MKLIEIVELANGIAKAQRDSAPRPVKFGFYLALNLQEIRSTCEAYEESRRSLLEQFGEKEEGGSLKIDEHGNVVIADMDGLRKALTELNTQEVGVTLHKLNLNDFPAELPPAVVAGILPLIEVEALS